MIGNLIRIIFFFFIIYFFIHVGKYIIKVSIKQSDGSNKKQEYNYHDTKNKVIELDKDDYKIE
jgi:hypothetical protein